MTLWPWRTPEALPEGAHRVLSGEALIQNLRQTGRIRSIRRLTGTDPQTFESLYLKAIYNFSELVQLAPASENHHHSTHGGLLVHTMQAIEEALRLRLTRKLPQGSAPEDLGRIAPIWTYAVFVAALLHDAAKPLTNMRFSDSATGNTISLHSGSMVQLGIHSYRFAMVKADYDWHRRLSLMMMRLLPADGLELLGRDLKAMNQVAAYLYGDNSAWGEIGELAGAADGTSVAYDLQLGGGNTKVIPESSGKSLHARTLQALRELVGNGEFAVNRPGAALYVVGDKTYGVAAVVANKVLDHMRAAGARDIPTDRSRLFDIWQDHHIAVPTAEGKAIHSVEVVEGDWQTTLSVLVFMTSQLYTDSTKPGAWPGTVKDVASTKPGAADRSSSTEKKGAPAKDSDHNQTKAEAVRPDVKTGGIEEPTKISDEQVGRHFLAWIKAGLKDKGIKYNMASAFVHIVPEGVLIISPKAFKEYVAAHFPSENADSKSVFGAVQRKVLGLKLHDRENDMNMISYKIKDSKGKLFGNLFPASVIYGTAKPPPVNNVLSKTNTGGNAK